MPQIHLLDSATIDKIAAGEVVERPASVVKELVENAIDAGAGAITVDARDGGIEFLRVTDDGCGMGADQIRTAFMRHATSKIESVEDLARISSLGFRGEALSSIAAVSRVEVITRTKESLTGIRYVMEGAREKEFEEVGAPEGTTFLMRNLFYNTPARRKFLKQPATEAGYIADLMEHLALSRPDISFKFMLKNQVRFHTSGNGDLREVIYRVYGRDVVSGLLPVRESRGGIRVEGYLGDPSSVRPNRNFEIFFLNGRFIRNQLMTKAVEEGYREYLMQHRFPLCILHITMDCDAVDVNVHPAKMDVRFADGAAFSGLLSEIIRETLRRKEMIPEAALPEPEAAGTPGADETSGAVEAEAAGVSETAGTPGVAGTSEAMEAGTAGAQKTEDASGIPGADMPSASKMSAAQAPREVVIPRERPGKPAAPHTPEPFEKVRAERYRMMEETRYAAEGLKAPEQLDLFEEKLLSAPNRSRFHIIGQVFDTYWIVQFEDRMFIIDQHAAHEKVKYERLMKQLAKKEILSQNLMPPIILSLSGQEEALLNRHRDAFARLGFEIEDFGGSEYALRSVPTDLYGCGEKEMFREVLNGLDEESARGSLQAVEEKIASMSCKAAVKGNRSLSVQEAEALIDELLTLDNPYNCPHGRPTIISLTKTELEKKFKRIV